MVEYERNPDGSTTEVRRTSNSMGWLIALLVVVALVVAAFAFGLINIDQTRETKLPTVSVDTSGGQTPKFDVNTAKVDVGTKQEGITVPTVDVGTKKTDIAVPTISVEKADKDK